MKFLEFLNEGIYCIHNNISNEMYIGSTMNLGGRKTKHFSLLKHGKHVNERLQQAVNELGIENFSFEVIEYCTQNIAQREQYYVDMLKPVYNITTDVVLNCPSKESRGKISATRIRLFKEGKIKPNCARAIIQTDMEGNFLSEFESLGQAARVLKMSRTSIQRVLSGKYLQMKGFKFQRKSTCKMPLNRESPAVGNPVLNQVVTNL